MYFAFGMANAAWQAWALFAVYGVFYGMTEGTEKALVVDMVPRAKGDSARAGTTWRSGSGRCPASLIFGAIWDHVGVTQAAFMFGAAMALLASVGTCLSYARVQQQRAPGLS